MSQAANIAERRQEMLGKLAELDLSGAQTAHTRYMESIGTDQEAETGLTYQRMARSLRQTLALHEKFERANVRAARDARDDARRETQFQPREPRAPRRQFPRDIPAANDRADALRNAVHRVIWSEGFEKSDCETICDFEADLVRWLEVRLDEDRNEDHFIETPLDEQVAGICEELGLNPDNTARWRDLPAPDADVILRYLTDIHSGGRTPRRSSA